MSGHAVDDRSLASDKLLHPHRYLGISILFDTITAAHPPFPFDVIMNSIFDF